MPKNKKEESSSSSDDSSSEEVQKQPVKGKGGATPAKKDEKKPVKKQESSDDDSSSSSEDVKTKKATPAKQAETKKATPKKKVESSSDDSDSDSSSEEAPKKPAKKEEKKPAAKKAESSDSDSDSDSSSEEAPKKPAAKKEEPKKAATPAKKASKKESSDSDDSDSDSSSEEAPKKPAAKKAAKKESSDSDDSDSDDADEESEEKPAPKNDKKRKASDDAETTKPAAKKAKTEAGAVTTATEQNNGSAPETNRLFIGNLSFKIDDDAIRAFFKDVGELTDIHWVTDKQTGKFYGTGFVSFATAEEAKKAVAKNGESLLDRPIKIDFAQSRGERTPKKGGFEKKPFGDKPQREPRAPTPKPEGCTTVFLGNLSYQIDENAVRTHFADCGEITAIRWVERDGQFKGCGFVEFADSESTDKAVALNGSDLMGRPVRVDYSAPKSKK